ncbi:MAG TPA: PfkB family carbohydrate kinase [Solirubrobacteraceae bacterium]|jgi:ribokinase|nr:PfkB family carbohydrate kinase [Solirubrobacteraceae bacterium]
MTRIAVVGHVEWVQFLRVERFPVPGEIQRAQRESTHAGGGAVVAASMLTELGAEVEFYGAVGTDAIGDAAVRELTERGMTVHAARRPGPTREVLTLLDGRGERTILPIGERLQPEGDDDLDWDRLADADAAYITAGDQGALRRARAARLLVATPRLRERVEDPGVRIDALVFSASDGDEVQWAERLRSDTDLMVATEGAHGGHWWGASEGRWTAVPPPGPVRDSYGCGDAFAGGLTYGLAAGRTVAEACALGARWGAEMLTRVGAP